MKNRSNEHVFHSGRYTYTIISEKTRKKSCTQVTRKIVFFVGDCSENIHDYDHFHAKMIRGPYKTRYRKHPTGASFPSFTAVFFVDVARSESTKNNTTFDFNYLDLMSFFFRSNKIFLFFHASVCKKKETVFYLLI